MKKIVDIKIDKKEAIIVTLLLFLLIVDNIKQFFGSNLLTSGMHIYVCILVVLITCIFIARKPFSPDLVSILMIILTVIITLNILHFRNENEWGLSKYKAYVISLVVFYLARILVKIYNGENLSLKIAKGLATINTLLLVCFFIFNYKELIFNFKDRYRIGTYDLNPIWLARIMSETMLAYLILFKNGSKRLSRSFIIISEVGLLLLLFLTGAKGPLLSLLVVSLIYCIGEPLKKNKGILIKTLAISVVLFLVVPLIGESLSHGKSEFMVNRFSFDAIFNSAKGYRVDRYQFSLNQIPKQIFSGYGLGSWGNYYWEENRFDYPHSILLEMQFEIGLMGLLVFIIIVGRIIFSKKREKNIFLFFLMLEVGFAFFSGDFCGGNRGMFLYMGAASGYMTCHNKTKKRGRYSERAFVKKNSI